MNSKVKHSTITFFLLFSVLSYGKEEIEISAQPNEIIYSRSRGFQKVEEDFYGEKSLVNVEQAGQEESAVRQGHGIKLISPYSGDD